MSGIARALRLWPWLAAIASGFFAGLLRAFRPGMALLDRADAAARRGLVFRREFETPLAARFASRLRRGARVFLDGLFLAENGDRSRHGFWSDFTWRSTSPLWSWIVRACCAPSRDDRRRRSIAESSWTQPLSLTSSLRAAPIALAAFDEQSSPRLSSRGRLGRTGMAARPGLFRLGLEHPRDAPCTARLAIIQIAEFTGVAGLSFMVAFTNVIAARHRAAFNPRVTRVRCVRITI